MRHFFLLKTKASKLGKKHFHITCSHLTICSSMSFFNNFFSQLKVKSKVKIVFPDMN